MDLLIALMTLASLYFILELFLHMSKRWLKKSISYKLARFFRYASWIWEPYMCSCKECHVSSRLVDFHAMEYKIWGGTHSLTILCEDCWSHLTPAERWKIYEAFLKRHRPDPDISKLVYKATMCGE